MENSKSRIAAKIREAREWNKITQVGMAGKLGIARQTYLDLESGKTEPRVSTLVSVAEITGRPLSWFVYEGEGPVSHDEQEDIQQLLALFAQVPRSMRARLIEHNINFVSCWVDYVSAIKRK
ncbi:helix-turn-helix domain-containing protein [Photobacterium sagamiensis]|uniref:helix-turn-helix domain-containing protein n=1 Tax=Photobacterium sagamiensis TaxID=2910241 RepID=UPI003D09D6A6